MSNMNDTKKNNYYSVFEYDTKKRTKYSSKTIDKIVELKKNGKSIREIAVLLDIPFGSIHYMLRGRGEVNIYTSRPNNQYINRSEAMYMYDLTNSQFDYYRGRYKDKVIVTGNVVWIKREVFESKFGNKYKKQRDLQKEFNVDRQWLSNRRRYVGLWSYINSFDDDTYDAIRKYHKHIETIIGYIKDLKAKDFRKYKIAIKYTSTRNDKYPIDKVNNLLNEEYASLLYVPFKYIQRLDKIYKYAKDRYEK